MNTPNLKPIPGTTLSLDTQYFYKKPPLNPSSLDQTWKKLKDLFDSGEVGFFDCPNSASLSGIQHVKELIPEIQKKGYTDCLFIGIGGSALGPYFLLEALDFKTHSPIQFHFMENPDPYFWNKTIQKLNPDKTLVCAVTKSGKTFETMAQFQLALAWQGQSRWKKNIIIISDPEKGDLNLFAHDYDIKKLTIHPSIGGRFSAFCPVGLFPLALQSLDCDAFLEGAQNIRQYTLDTVPSENPFFIIADQLIQNYTQKNVHVFMPYSTQLRQLSPWWTQLWGESLGKDGKGFTPLSAVGAIDQHSLLQLLRDGPQNKVTFFVTIDHPKDSVTIPPIHTHQKIDSFELLKGHSLQKLLMTEYNATAQVLSAHDHPSLTLQIETLDEKNLGSLMFSIALLTAYTGVHWDVNPFDQPGVEEGKILTRQNLTT